MLCAIVIEDFGQHVGAAGYAAAGDFQAPLCWIVVHQCHYMPIGATAQFADQHGAGGAGADYDHRRALAEARAVQPVFLPHAPGCAPAAHDQEQQQGVQHQDGTRQCGLATVEEGKEQQRDRRGEHHIQDALEIGQAGEDPHATIQPGPAAGDDLHGQQDEQCSRYGAFPLGRPFEVEADKECP
ncbi:hypothetical protein D3C85_1182140 [compost metagenome]